MSETPQDKLPPITKEMRRAAKEADEAAAQAGFKHLEENLGADTDEEAFDGAARAANQARGDQITNQGGRIVITEEDLKK